MPNPESETSISATQFDTDKSNYHGKLDLSRCVLDARTNYGKGYISQMLDLWALSKKVGRITPRDYYYYRLYDPEKYSREAMSRFLSERIHWDLLRKCSDERWWAAADDKLVAQTLLKHAGVPLPEVQAVYATNGRNFGKRRTCRTPDELADFLGNEARYPLFAKPVAGIGSLGVFAIEGFDDGARTLELSGGKRMALSEFAQHLRDDDGYMLQGHLVQHPELEAVCGKAVSTVRVMVIIEDHKPEILATVWKIPTGDNIADNYWRSGNMLGAVESGTGEVERVVRSFGPTLQEPTTHPDSDKPLVGLTLPHWDAVRQLCLDYSMVYEKLRYQSWDIAIGPEGPVVVEVNAGSAFSLSQLASGRGMLTDRFTSFLQTNGYLDASGKVATQG